MVKFILILLALGLFFLLARQALAARSIPTISPKDAARRVASGDSVLIDVREPSEWRDGVAAPAHLLALSDLRKDRERWAPFLKDVGEKTLILQCRTGNRSGLAGKVLAAEGFTVLNVGGYSAWKAAQLPTLKPLNSGGQGD